MRTNKLIVYSKFCVKNSYGKDWPLVEKWAKEKGFDDVDIYRTIYNSDWHKEAVSVYRKEDYPPFVVYKGQPILITEIIKEMKGNNDVYTTTIKKSTKKALRKSSNRKVAKKDEK